MKVSWDDDIPNMESHKKIKNVPNHQADHSAMVTW
jgi:hypothetical protein